MAIGIIIGALVVVLVIGIAFTARLIEERERLDAENNMLRDRED